MHIEFLDAGDVIKIEGPPSDAEKAKEILESQANELVTKMDFCEIDVDAKYHKHIIGKGGSTGMYKLKTQTYAVACIIFEAIFLSTSNMLFGSSILNFREEKLNLAVCVV